MKVGTGLVSPDPLRDPFRAARRRAMRAAPPDPNLFVVFGGTGDLARRKLLPALCDLERHGHLGEGTHVLGVSPDDHDTESFRGLVAKALAAARKDEKTAQRLLARTHYHRLEPDGAGFRALSHDIEALELRANLPQNRAFYLALPPAAFPGSVEGLGEAGLNRSEGYTRIVVEKPFGRDFASASRLNELLHRHFSESQIYRIDHYLGKDTVQNLLVFRFANSIFESLWSRDRVDSVQITVAESLGVGTRAAYYDKAGALRDMVQNHMMQLLTLFAMEVPTAFEADAIRYEKIKVLRSLVPLGAGDALCGQYRAGVVDGAPVPGYLEESGIDASSRTETLVALRLFVNTWRWQGVPFYLRTGKRLKRRVSQIAVRFRDVPVSLFQQTGTELDTPDLLLITIQPDEGFSLHFDVKVPGADLELRRIPLSFKYKEHFAELPGAYETLLLDVLIGDQTLFVHADEVEASWKFFAALLKSPPPPHGYDAGTWGPEEARHLGIPEQELWDL
jgi:glucose-6-phosphate 1-dehydrogenase